MEILISEIEAYCAARGIQPTTFGKEAGVGGVFIGRLRDGRSCTLATVEKIRRYMAENPPPAPEAEAAPLEAAE